jgi:GT2 family glycosyltransferase/glycosyltransferase involved in cell wall biosynthesis
VKRQFSNLPGSDRCGFYALLRTSTPGPIILEAELVSGRVAATSSGRTLSLKNRQTENAAARIELAMADCLSLPREEKPSISIIIPVYDQIDVTLDCLHSIKLNTIGLPYEVIVVDDNSSAHTQECLHRIKGLRVLRHTANAGFLDSCNDGAAMARGEFLIFLNNDTEPQKGWIQALLRVFKERPDAGLVGAKLVYPDGRLQEAGAIIFNDASGWNYGRNDHPGKPEYNYVREVDYCSGACIAIRRSLFERVAKFDPLYRPAYYEDTDLAFKVREAGKKVYYQPHAAVIHHEGVTSGTDTATGVKSYQVVNRDKFRSKWTRALSQQFEAGEDQVRLAKQRGVKLRALVVDARVLCPDQDAGSLRMLKILEILQQCGFQVTFAPYNGQRVSPYTEKMQEMGVECLYDPFFGNFDALFLERAAEFDVIILSRAETAEKVISKCREYAPQTPIIFDTVDLHFLRAQREAKLTNDETKWKYASDMEALELGLGAASDAVIVVSTEETRILKEKLPESRIAIVSMIHEVQSVIPPFSDRRDFFFVGGFEHTPNVDAMLWFCSKIMPRVLEQLPDAKLHIIGSKITEDIRSLADEHIIIHGYVERLEPFLQTSILSVAPLRYGAGVKGKITQSMSFGVPVVSTTIGAEGMHLTHGENILVADTPRQFAQCIVQLHREPALWERLSINSLKNIQEHFSFATAKRDLKALLSELKVIRSQSDEAIADQGR